MPRIRTIKPEFWTDARVVRLSLHARLLFIGSWNFADDFGCIHADAMELKLRVLPAEDVDPERLVAELIGAGMFEELVTPDGRVFWHVTHWTRHQRPNRSSPSEYGPSDQWRKAPTRAFSESSVSSQGALSEDSRGKGTEGKGREGKGRELATTARTANPVWDALAYIFGEPTTDTNRRLRGKVVASLRQAGALGPDIIERAHNWPDHFPDAELTETALEKHWDRLGRPPLKATSAQVESARQRNQQEHDEARARQLDAQRRGLPAGGTA